jgi:hypothetical protein
VECAGFSITVPNWEKEDWVRSSMGIRMDGQGIEVGMVPQLGVVRRYEGRRSC